MIDPFEQLKKDAEETYIKFAKSLDSTPETQLFTAIRDVYENRKYWDKTHDLQYSNKMIISLYAIQQLSYLTMLNVLNEELIAVSLFGYTYNNKTDLRVLIEDLDLNNRDKRELPIMLAELEASYKPTVKSVGGSEDDTKREIKRLADLDKKRFELRIAILLKNRRYAKTQLAKRIKQVEIESKKSVETMQRDMANFEVKARKTILNLRPSIGRIARNIDGMTIGLPIPRTVQTLYSKIRKKVFGKLNDD